MQRALDEARMAYKEGEIPIGAVVVCKDRIIARSHNLTETLCDVTAHAEMQAITSAANLLGGKYLTECTLYVTVEPCVMSTHCLRLSRRETGLSRLCATSHASQSHHRWRRLGRRMPATDAGFLQTAKNIITDFPTTENQARRPPDKNSGCRD